MWSQIKYCLKRDKVACLGWLGLIVSFAFIFHIIYWMLYPYKTTVIHNSPYPVHTNEVSRGENMVMHLEFTKYTDLPGHIAQSIQCGDGGYISLAPIETTRPAGEYQQDVLTYIPMNSPTGNCRMNFILTYQVNPIREISITAESEYFTITE